MLGEARVDLSEWLSQDKAKVPRGQGAERAMAEGRGMVAEAEVPRC